MSNKHKQPRPKTCDDRCDFFCYIGEGDSICTKKMPPVLVMDEWKPAEDFLWCEGGVRK